MATTTYVPIEAKTLGSNTASVTFSSIPQTYTDLIIVANIGCDTANQRAFWQVNGDTSSNYSKVYILGDGSNPYSLSDSNQTASAIFDGIALPTAIGANLIQHYQNYSNTTTYKTVLSRCNNSATATGGNGGTSVAVGLWRSTSAITSITLFTSTSKNWLAGSTFTLYGIANADTGAKATGGIITYDSTYYYHTFGSSGTFTPSQNLTADVLVVAGGGGGTYDRGAGGGAGGVSYISASALTQNTNYTVTVGAGGAKMTGYGTGNNGGNSVFNSITSNGGGGGGTTGGGSTNGNAGGSGGGAGSGTAGTGGSSNQGNTGGATGYGNAGGNSNTTGGVSASGGGGGAGGVGAPGANNLGGAGGVGITNSTINTLNAFGSATGTGQFSNGNYYYAGGGGGSVDQNSGNKAGGAGGLGGGGAGGSNANTAGTDGTANTGGGGGGGSNGAPANGGNGGSGIVIIRYAK